MQREVTQFQQPSELHKWGKGHEDKRDDDFEAINRFTVSRKRGAQTQKLSPIGRSYTTPELRLGSLLRAAWAAMEEEDLAEDIDGLASKLDIEPEQLFAKALREFVEKYEDESFEISKEIDAAYDEELEEEDEEFLSHVRRYQGRVIDSNE